MIMPAEIKNYYIISCARESKRINLMTHKNNSIGETSFLIFANAFFSDFFELSSVFSGF